MSVQRVQVLQKKVASPITCCPVIRECSWKKTQIEKKNCPFVIREKLMSKLQYEIVVNAAANFWYIILSRNEVTVKILLNLKVELFVKSNAKYPNSTGRHYWQYLSMALYFCAFNAVNPWVQNSNFCNV